MHSLLYAVQAQKTPIDRHADVLETNRSPWFCRNPSTSHLHKQKLHSPNDKLTKKILTAKLKDRITPHVTNFFRLRLTIEEQEGKREYKSDGAVMVGEFVCMYVCSCTVSE